MRMTDTVGLITGITRWSLPKLRKMSNGNKIPMKNTHSPTTIRIDDTFERWNL